MNTWIANTDYSRESEWIKANANCSPKQHYTNVVTDAEGQSAMLQSQRENMDIKENISTWDFRANNINSFNVLKLLLGYT